MDRRLVPMIVALLLAGCAGSSATDPAAPTARFDAPVTVAPEGPGGEPVLATHPDGALFLQAVGGSGSRLWRSLDDGGTWVDVTPPEEAARGDSLDGFVAIAQDGTIYYANAYSRAALFDATLEIYRSDDAAETWTKLLLPPWPTPMHRMWIVPDGASSVHLAVEGLFPNLGLWYTRSDDAGATWTAPTPVDPGNGFGSDLAVRPGGQEIHAERLSFRFEGSEPQYDEGGVRYMMSSLDGGRTWQRRDLFPQEERIATSWQRLIADENGALYLVWSEMHDAYASAMLSVSLDGGERWSVPLAFGNGTSTHALPWATLRAPGELVLVWYAAASPGHPNDVDAEWHVEVAFVRNATGPAPSFEVHRASATPVKEGALCTDGPFCGPFPGGEDRELLDYPWVVVGGDSLARVAYAEMTEDGVVPVFARERPT